MAGYAGIRRADGSGVLDEVDRPKAIRLPIPMHYCSAQPFLQSLQLLMRSKCSHRGCEASPPATKSHHGSRIRNEIRTNVTKRPANAFLNQVVQIWCARAARQADNFSIIAAKLSPLATKEMECEQLYSRIVHSSVTQLTAAGPSHQKFLLQCLPRMAGASRRVAVPSSDR